MSDTPTDRESVERCAECDCQHGGVYCNWIKSPYQAVHAEMVALRAALDEAEARAEALEAERDRLAEKLAVYEAKEAAYSARLQEHFRVKQQCDRCGHQSINWLGENAACPRHSCSGGMVTLAKMEKPDDHTD